MASNSSTSNRIGNAKGTAGGSKASLWIILGLVGLIVVAAVAALLLSGGDDADDGDGAKLETANVAVTGSPLAPFNKDVTDTAIDEIAPDLVGSTFDGSEVSITNDGRPKMIAFVAHWCGYCQREVPSVQGWLDDNGAPEGVDLYAVSTGVRSDRDNYPPSKWLEREGWSVSTMADSTDSAAAAAFGLTGYPFWVAINADGTVAARLSSEQPPEVLDQLVEQLTS